MCRSLMFTVVVIACTTLQSVSAGQEATKADFTEFCKATEGHWRGVIELWQDIPGIGKKGDNLTVDWVFTFAAKGNALVGNGSDDTQGTATSITYYDAEKRQIRGIIVFSGGSIESYIVAKQAPGKWLRLMTTVDPDGTKSEAKDTLVVSAGGNTHTWTRDDRPLTWRRLDK